MSSKISIIIPTFNRANLIQQTLDSVLNQFYTNWECIIVDDGSIDNSLSVIDTYVRKDNRFKFISRPNNRLKGASTCRNIGLENASGDFIQFLDSDDLISANKISEQIRLLKDRTENVIAICKWGRFKNYIDDSEVNESLRSYRSFDNMLFFLDELGYSKGYFPPNAYLIKMDIIRKVGLWNENISINDDGEFMMRVIASTDKIYFAPNAIAYYRYTENGNLSNFNDKERVNDAIESWKLVETYLKIRFKKNRISYIELMKEALFVNVKNSYPELIDKHAFFFKKQLENSKLLNRISDKVKRIVAKFIKLIYLNK